MGNMRNGTEIVSSCINETYKLEAIGPCFIIYFII